MKWSTIADIAEVNPNGAASLGSGTTVSFVPMSAVQLDGSVVEEERSFGEVCRGYTPFRRGDIVIAKITPCFENGKVAHLKNLRHEWGFGSTEFHVLRPGPDVDPGYLYRFVNTAHFRDRGERRMTGSAGQQRVPQDFVAGERIPLPPLQEQERIAAILDKADAIRRKREQAIKLADEFLRSLFLDMFVRGASRSGCTEVALGQTATYIRTGPFGSQLLHSEFVDSGISVLGIDNAVSNRFVWAKPRFITTQKYQQLKRYTVCPGDVLITIMGTCGRVAVVPEDIGTAINTKHLCCLTLDRDMILPEFLHAALLCDPRIRTQLGISQRGAIMDGLNMQIIRDLRLALPPISQQQKFVSAVRAFSRVQDTIIEQLGADITDLSKALSRRAFKGEL